MTWGCIGQGGGENAGKGQKTQRQSDNGLSVAKYWHPTGRETPKAIGLVVAAGEEFGVTEA